MPRPYNPNPAILRAAFVAAQLGFYAGNWEAPAQRHRQLDQVYPRHTVAGVADAIKAVGVSQVGKC